MNNRITQLFSSGRKDLLSVYYTAGYPGLEDTAAIAGWLEAAGVDFIELGIPFSDPVADGPTIQASNKVALDNGMNLHLLIKQVKELRKKVQIPVILMGYLNPVMQYGMEQFCADAVEAGVDGLILPDMPMEEYLNVYRQLFEKHNLSNTFLISPTTSEARIRKIDSVTNGFIYAVAASSTTGARDSFSEDQVKYFSKLQSLGLHNPFMIGFGISNAGTFTTACTYGSGAIVGSAFINVLREARDLEKDIQAFVSSLKNGKAGNKQTNQA
ncbi:MAG TPA: tryptophan synthase subunit alpha [Cyclobacteriaceae bacterium]|nr:tryptophan synthase subunit alpha [Cyclobacteriaceae bacterium]